MAITKIENLWIPLADKRRLAASLWLPSGNGPHPAILEYLPYRKRDGTASRDETTHTVFAEAGYACLRVDISGTGDSTGQFDDEYSEQELQDGEAVLEWVASQDWSDGTVGMIGISWGGFNGLQLAHRRPAALKAVVSVASTVDRYADDIHFMGGCLLSDNANWGGQMFAYLTRPADPLLRPDWREDWLQRLENVPFSAADWLRHSSRNEFWKHGSVCEDWQAIQIPVLAITGWADAYVNAPTALAANLETPTKAIIGPWEHRYGHISKLAPADFHSEVIGWFDRWLKGERNGAEDLPTYRTFMQEHSNPTSRNTPPRGRWIAEQSWPSDNISEQPFHLTLDGLSQSSSHEQIAVESPSQVGQAGGYFCPGMRIDNELAGDQAEDDALSQCFDTPPLESHLEILGRARLQIRFSVDKPVAQLVARVCDVSPEGVSQRISYRPLNLCHHNSHETPTALIPGQFYDAEILLNECAHRLHPGHRLRLALSTSYWPIVWPAPENATVVLHLHNCVLHLPIRTVEEEIEAANPGPVQDFPVLQAQELRPPEGRSKRAFQDDGTLVLETFDDYGKTEHPSHGLICGSHVSMHYGIRPDDPASANFESRWNFTFERGNWQVEIDTKSTMHCDANNFYLTRELRATESKNKTEVLTKEWSETIPRRLL